MSREQREISLTVLLVNCHDVTGRIFGRWISRQTGTKSPLKWHNQPEKKSSLGAKESLSNDQIVSFRVKYEYSNENSRPFHPQIFLDNFEAALARIEKRK